MSYLMPELTNTFLTPGTALILFSRAICLPWSICSDGHGESPRQDLSWQAPCFSLRAHSIPYMLAVGPPTSCMMPLKCGSDAMRSTSLMMESSERETTVLPWCIAMAQKEHSP